MHGTEFLEIDQNTSPGFPMTSIRRFPFFSSTCWILCDETGTHLLRSPRITISDFALNIESEMGRINHNSNLQLEYLKSIQPYPTHQAVNALFSH